jgi:glyceraldehyde 3-phosphate dehydrogenase
MDGGIGISGMGRIGRLLIRKAFSGGAEGLEIKAINSIYPVETIAHLLKYDSTHGRWDADLSIQDGKLCINGRLVQYKMERDPSSLDWRAMGVSLAIDATGKFNDRDGASKHLAAGAHTVLITAPSKNADLTVVMGVNEQRYDSKIHHIISAASCTTNCAAPLLHILDQAFAIKQGWMTTVHAFTSDQNHLDNPHPDLRRARACAQSIIPTTTGAGKALKDVLPHLAPVIQGISIRVPTPNVSLLDLTVQLGRDVTYEEVYTAFHSSINNRMRSIMDIVDVPLVSSDFIGSEYSAIIDGPSLMVTGNQLKVLAWYDNEWGYSSRVMDLAALMVKKINGGAMEIWNQVAAT